MKCTWLHSEDHEIYQKLGLEWTDWPYVGRIILLSIAGLGVATVLSLVIVSALHAPFRLISPIPVYVGAAATGSSLILLALSYVTWGIRGEDFPKTEKPASPPLVAEKEEKTPAPALPKLRYLGEAPISDPYLDSEVVKPGQGGTLYYNACVKALSKIAEHPYKQVIIASTGEGRKCIDVFGNGTLFDDTDYLLKPCNLSKVPTLIIVCQNSDIDDRTFQEYATRQANSVDGVNFLAIHPNSKLVFLTKDESSQLQRNNVLPARVLQ